MKTQYDNFYQKIRKLNKEELVQVTGSVVSPFDFTDIGLEPTLGDGDIVTPDSFKCQDVYLGHKK